MFLVNFLRLYIIGSVQFVHLETMVSFNSTAPFSHDELNRMLDWVNNLTGVPVLCLLFQSCRIKLGLEGLDISYPGSAYLVGRLMKIFSDYPFHCISIAETKINNYH